MPPPRAGVERGWQRCTVKREVCISRYTHSTYDNSFSRSDDTISATGNASNFAAASGFDREPAQVNSNDAPRTPYLNTTYVCKGGQPMHQEWLKLATHQVPENRRLDVSPPSGRHPRTIAVAEGCWGINATSARGRVQFVLRQQRILFGGTIEGAVPTSTAELA